jgi:hypothetical protein
MLRTRRKQARNKQNKNKGGQEGNRTGIKRRTGSKYDRKKTKEGSMTGNDRTGRKRTGKKQDRKKAWHEESRRAFYSK